MRPSLSKEPLLFDTCANQRCGAAFDYRKGRLFRFSYQLKNAEPGKNHAVVHFWLCPKCARTYSLEYREKSGTAVLRLKNPPTRILKSKTTPAKTQQPMHRRLREKVSAA